MPTRAGRDRSRSSCTCWLGCRRRGARSRHRHQPAPRRADASSHGNRHADRSCAHRVRRLQQTCGRRHGGAHAVRDARHVPRRHAAGQRSPRAAPPGGAGDGASGSDLPCLERARVATLPRRWACCRYAAASPRRADRRRRAPRGPRSRDAAADGADGLDVALILRRCASTPRGRCARDRRRRCSSRQRRPGRGARASATIATAHARGRRKLCAAPRRTRA